MLATVKGTRLTLAALATLVLLAGCIGFTDGEPEPTAADPEDGIETQALSKPVHALDEIREAWVPTHGDTSLHAAEYHPNGTSSHDGERPVVIVLSPYWGNLAPEAQAGTEDDYFVELFVERGYTLVHASVRGTGYSEGCYQLGGPDEVEDAKHLVEHYHDADWSNGNVALIGASYPGTTPWQAAIQDPDGLATIVPVAGITDMYRYMFKDGAAYTHGPLFPTYYTAATGWVQQPFNAEGPEHVLPLTESVCPDVADNMAKGYETWIQGDHDAFWDDRDYEAHLDSVDVPVFLVHGLQDWNVNPDNGVPLFDDLPAPKKAWLGQWAHAYPHATGSEDTNRPDWNATLVAWMDQWLKGKATGVLDEDPVLYQDSHHRWHAGDTWPPRTRHPNALYATGDGTLTDTVPREDAQATMGPFPAGAAPNRPEAVETLTSSQRVTFTSEPLEENTTIVGEPTLHVNVSLDQPDGHLVAHLYAASEDQRDWLGLSLLNLAHRDSREASTSMEPGVPEHVELTFFPLAAHLKTGQRLELELQPEDGEWIHPSPYTPTYTFHLDEDAPASLLLETLEDPAPVPVPSPGEVPFS